MRVEVLGNAQDGGVPHLGYRLEIDEEAREDPRKQRYVSSLLLKENEDSDTVRYLIDATPDIRFQITGDYLDGVFVPHARLGHITGLLYFGEEGKEADQVSVYCNTEVEDYLMKNDPYRFLVDRGNIDIRNFGDGDTLEIQGGEIEAHSLEHSQIGHPTTGYIIRGDERTLYYLSDIPRLEDEVLDQVKEADIAIIDGTFWSEDEIDRYDQVTHPTIRDSLKKLGDFDTDIYFTHLNHTNPALREDTEEREELEEKGFEIVEKGDEFEV